MSYVDANGWSAEDHEYAVHVAQTICAAPLKLYKVMNAESGLRTTAKHASGAKGLNQMMPSTLKSLGWRGGDYCLASVRDQLDLAGRYFAYWRSRFSLPRWETTGQLYLANFMPARLPLSGDPDADLEASEMIVKQNGILDRNKDGRILVKELSEFVEAQWAPRGVVSGNAYVGLMGLQQALGAVPAEKADSTPKFLTGSASPPTGTTRQVQEALNKLGASLAVDGIYGAGTRKAVCAFQAAHGLRVDGLVGPVTWGVLLRELAG